MLGASGYGAGSLVFDKRWQRAGAGATVALTAGGAKELYDLAGYGDPSYKDLVFDVAGTALGVIAAYLIDLATSSDRTHGDAPATKPAALRF